MDVITSLQNDRVKLAHALQTQSRARRKEGKIVLEGARLIEDAIERGGVLPDFILYQPDTIPLDLLERWQAQALPVLPAAPAVMAHISATEQPPGIVAVFDRPADSLPSQPNRVLILDAIRDPGNLGTLLRTAAAAGVEAVLLSPDTVDPYNPKVLRSGMGAHFRIGIVECPWAAIADTCADLPVYLADADGDAPYFAPSLWAAGWALIIGSEAHGASEAAQRLAAQRIYIPMQPDAESLNAAVAAGIILFEARRQHPR